MKVTRRNDENTILISGENFPKLIGKKLTCQECKSDLELEIGDTVFQSFEKKEQISYESGYGFMSWIKDAVPYISVFCEVCKYKILIGEVESLK